MRFAGCSLPRTWQIETQARGFRMTNCYTSLILCIYEDILPVVLPVGCRALTITVQTCPLHNPASGDCPSNNICRGEGRSSRSCGGRTACRRGRCSWYIRTWGVGENHKVHTCWRQTPDMAWPAHRTQAIPAQLRNGSSGLRVREGLLLCTHPPTHPPVNLRGSPVRWVQQSPLPFFSEICCTWSSPPWPSRADT